MNREGDILVKTKQYRQLADLNKKFHFKIYKSLPHHVILKMISDLWDKTRMLPQVFTHSVERCRQSQKEHKLIVKALKKGDGESANDIIKKQNIDAGNHLLEFLNKQELEV